MAYLLVSSDAQRTSRRVQTDRGGPIDAARPIDLTLGFAFSAQPSPRPPGASAIIGGRTVEHVGTMASVSNITVADWQIAVTCLMRWDTGSGCAIELHRLVPVIDSRYSAEAVDAGYARLRSGETFGKVLFTL